MTVVPSIGVCILPGDFLYTMPMHVLSTSIFFPIFSDKGLDPVRFGIIVAIVVEMALVMPPKGIDVFVTLGLATDVSPLGHFRAYVRPAPLSSR